MEGALVGKCDQISLHTYMKFSDNKKLSVISYLKKKNPYMEQGIFKPTHH